MAFKWLPFASIVLHLLCMNAHATSVWKGPDLTVTQFNNEPNTVVDILIPEVASLGRGNIGPLCNTEGADACGTRNMTMPSDLEFAFSNLNGNPAIVYGSAESFAAFTFANFVDSVEGGPGNNLPPAIQVSVPGVGRIVSANVYFDIEILNWQSGRGGGFSYRRSTVPEPATVVFAALGICLSAGRRRPVLSP